jgi:hypothetical protein
MHYSGVAARHRAKGIAGRQDRFEKLRRSVSLKRVLAAAEEVLMASAIPASLRGKTLSQLGRRHLSESLLQLIFQYKRAFEAVRQAT